MDGDKVTAQFVQVDVRSFDRTLVRKPTFRCGKPELDEWLHSYAGQQ